MRTASLALSALMSFAIASVAMNARAQPLRAPTDSDILSKLAYAPARPIVLSRDHYDPAPHFFVGALEFQPVYRLQPYAEVWGTPDQHTEVRTIGFSVATNVPHNEGLRLALTYFVRNQARKDDPTRGREYDTFAGKLPGYGSHETVYKIDLIKAFRFWNEMGPHR